MIAPWYVWAVLALYLVLATLSVAIWATVLWRAAQ